VSSEQGALSRGALASSARCSVLCCRPAADGVVVFAVHVSFDELTAPLLPALRLCDVSIPHYAAFNAPVDDLCT